MAWWEEAAAASPRAVPIRCSALHWGWEEMEDSQGETPGFSQPCQANSDRKAPWLGLKMKQAARLLRAEPGSSTTPGPPPQPKSRISAMPVNTNTPRNTHKEPRTLYFQQLVPFALPSFLSNWRTTSGHQTFRNTHHSTWVKFSYAITCARPCKCFRIVTAMKLLLSQLAIAVNANKNNQFST